MGRGREWDEDEDGTRTRMGRGWDEDEDGTRTRMGRGRGWDEDEDETMRRDEDETMTETMRQESRMLLGRWCSKPKTGTINFPMLPRPILHQSKSVINVQ